MDSEGWVPLELVSNFNRIRTLTSDPSFIAASLKNSNDVEVNATNDKVRKKVDWQIWLFPSKNSEDVSQE